MSYPKKLKRAESRDIFRDYSDESDSELSQGFSRGNDTVKEQDPDFTPVPEENLPSSSAEDTDSSQSQSQNKYNDDYEKHVKEPKVIVFLSALLSLFKFCQDCGSPVTDTKERRVGATVIITTTCLR